MNKYHIQVVTWVEVLAPDQWEAREVTVNGLRAGGYSEEYAKYSEIEEVIEIHEDWPLDED